MTKSMFTDHNKFMENAAVVECMLLNFPCSEDILVFTFTI